MIDITPETPDQHAAAIEALYDRTFGPGHFAKTAERLREGNASLPDITRVAVSDGEVIGVCRVWPIFVGVEGLLKRIVQRNSQHGKRVCPSQACLVGLP